MFERITNLFSSTQDTETLPPVQPQSYTAKQLAKAGLVFAGTVGTFFALKTTGSFGALTSWFRRNN